jgi:type III pantothenate kinase
VLLAVDIGNTNVVFGLYEARDLKQTFRASTVSTRTADEYGVAMRQMLTLRGYDPSGVTAAILASVVPPLTDVMTDAIRHAFAREPLVVGPGLKTGIAVLYENPREVGADRICNAVAAFERIHGGVIVVDFGTATTFDCISPKGEYIGGVIVPGIQVSLDGLLGHAAKLARIEIAEPPRIVGRNTTHALQSGLIHGYASLVDGLVQKIEDELGFPCTVIATGSLSQHILKYTKKVQTTDPFLTLNGLRILHERNTLNESDSSPRGRSRSHR